jgi:hypothetical protein
MKLLPLTGASNPIALVDWIGNDRSIPSVAVYNPGTSFVSWANLAGSEYPYSCTPSAGGADPIAVDYTLFGEQSDVVASGDLLYFAGASGQLSGGAYFNDVVYYAFQYNPIGIVCGAPSSSTSGYNTVAVVQGSGGGIPASPVAGEPWHITLSYTSNSITLGFGEQDVLGSAIGTCVSSGVNAGTCNWVVLPDSVTKVSGLMNGLSSVYSTATSNIGTVWVEESATSATGYVVAFALI